VARTRPLPGRCRRILADLSQTTPRPFASTGIGHTEDKNALQDPKIRMDTRGAAGEFKAVPITDAKQVSAVVEKFRDKYGAGDGKKYSSKFDVAVLVKLR